MGRHKRGMLMDSGKPTTLSLLKSGRGDGCVSCFLLRSSNGMLIRSSSCVILYYITYIQRTNSPNPKDKIALMEAKLRQMESSSSIPSSSASASTSTSTTTPSAHPSLPPKPPTQALSSFHLHSQPHDRNPPSTSASGQISKPKPKHPLSHKEKHPLPSLPILPSSHPKPKSTADFASSLSSSYTPATTGKTTTAATPPALDAKATTSTTPTDHPPSQDANPESKASAKPGIGSTRSNVHGPGRSSSGLAGVKIVRRG
ncbi:hypothetical protein PILCRDRAFT_633045 [Piloderma croceum F 1598]|uniref:Uncharacterized protein n=1 Tax=Piloderma croceum (strain F 1598) TaxID=765440 RepID=A0A0C3BHM3_PILCF|nr:hypothetical protein PILCRDRAFT_633045 [Piloderma croceum F 1598]